MPVGKMQVDDNLDAPLVDTFKMPGIGKDLDDGSVTGGSGFNSNPPESMPEEDGGVVGGSPMNQNPPEKTLPGDSGDVPPVGMGGEEMPPDDMGGGLPMPPGAAEGGIGMEEEEPGGEMPMPSSPGVSMPGATGTSFAMPGTQSAAPFRSPSFLLNRSTGPAPGQAGSGRFGAGTQQTGGLGAISDGDIELLRSIVGKRRGMGGI